MAFTSDQLTALEQAYAAGELTVRHGDKSITYANMDALWAAILRLRRALRSSSTRYIGGVAGYRRNA